MIRKFLVPCLFAVLPALATPADAQAAATLPKPDPAEAQIDSIAKLVDQKAADESIFEFSYASPGSPVLPLIGVTGDQITRSESFRKFGIGFLNGFGGQQTGPGIAIDFSPYWLLSQRAMSLSEYQASKNKLGRIAARTKIGLAASFGDKASARPSSYVASVSSSLLDDHDSLTDTVFEDCVRKSDIPTAIRAFHNQPDDDATNDGVADFNRKRDAFDAAQPKMIEEAYATCATKLAKDLANKPSLDVGAGIRFRGLPGEFSGLESSGTIIWATYATGVVGGAAGDEERAGPLAKLRIRGVLHGRYTFNDDVFDDKFVLQGQRNSAMLVAGIESAPASDPKKVETLRWNAQVGWNQQSAVLPTDVEKDYWRYTATLNLRIADGLWLNGTVGKASGKGIKTDTKALVSFTFTPPSKASQVTGYYNSRN